MSNYLTKEQVNQLNEKHGWFEFGDAQSDVSMAFAQDAIAMYLAATEAAKATGTAELPPSDGVIEFYEESGRIGRSWTESAWLEQAVREYGQACAEAVLCAPDGESWQHKFEETDRALLYWKAKAKQAEAARQPAPVPGLPFADLATPIKEFEARKAALAATAAPVTMPEDIATDDALWRAGCKAFRLALNEMTGCDGYVVRKTYEALRAHILGSQP